jgi:AraC-like DNA-binding protein
MTLPSSREEAAAGSFDHVLRRSQLLKQDATVIERHRGMPVSVLQRIMGMDSFKDPQGRWEVAEFVVAEAVAYGMTSGDYYLSCLVDSGKEGAIDADLSAGKFRRENRPGNLVFASPSAHVRLEGAGPFHSRMMYLNKEDFERRVSQITGAASVSLGVLSSGCFRDQTLEILLRNLLDEYRATAYVGQKLVIEDLMDGICGRLVAVAGVKIKSNVDNRSLAPEAIQRTLDYMHANFQLDLGRDELAAIAQVTPRYFTQLFHKTVGQTPKRYLLTLRIERAKELLRDKSSENTISRIAEQCGFFNTSHLCLEFKRQVGTTPNVYRDYL